MKSTKLLQVALLSSFMVLGWSCKDKEDTEPVIDPSSEVAVNNWIYDVMDEVYYWVSDLGTPIADDSDPEDYFESLLYKPTDRFSVIYPDYQELINSLSGVTLEAGYEFQLYLESTGSTNVIAEISYVKKGSPAEAAGLVRGDIITHINGVQMTTENYRELLGETEAQHTITYLSINPSSLVYEEQAPLTLEVVQLSENPNYIDTVYTIEGQKIGYFMYNFFAPGNGGTSTVYDQETDEIFAKFKAEGIQHLIIDFRYNGGGYVSSATNLASLIAPNVTNTDIFSKTKYNNILMSEIPELANVKTAFKVKAQNLGNILEGNRVYVLTSQRTASASELVINGLKPYLDVFMIGDVTYGKNVGSIPFEDEDNPDNPYGILPIVSQSFNSLDQSDYSTGFTPNIEVRESSERLSPLGNVNELLLRTAIEQITGVPSSGRFEKLDRKDIGSTLERKVRFGNMIENQIIK
ncbi:S41 family peptidase [Algoriphagus machipongonensis]|uniref:Periplasmic protease n=1 Tax=Algoriphagus machipongonensis TaxID=388413 RepID=A3HZH2_9BACT|nr:S41 family peptidase [Algoriphagus machipongonensis]EAZ80658.1 putative periplasmic protease [Algoriphagus machipongonensis]